MNHWIKFWDQEDIVSDKIWKLNGLFFYKNTLNIFNYSKNDIILDIGGGKGFFSEILIDKVKEVYVCDTSKRSINICNEKFKNNKNVHTIILKSQDYINFDFVKSAPTKIFVISVIQYYRSISEFERLIKNCQKICNSKNSSLLIADIPIENSPFKEAFSTIYKSIFIGTFFHTIIYFLKLYFGNYRKFRRESGLMIYKKSELKFIMNKMKLKYKFYKGLTSVGIRLNILIKLN